MRKLVRMLLLAASLSLLTLSWPAIAKAPKVGSPAPDVELTLQDGSRVQLSQLRGQVVVLNFWATWCVPCRTELPTLDTYYRLQRSHGLRVFAVTTEGSVPQSRLKTLFGSMTMTPLKRLKGPYAPIKGAVPTNYVIDRAGVIRHAAAGAFDLDALNRILVPLLRERAPPPAAS